MNAFTLVNVTGTNVSIQDLTVSGYFTPVGSGNAYGVVSSADTFVLTNVTVTGIRYDPMGGNITGFAVYITAGDATITDCTVSDFQRQGIRTLSPGHLTVTGCTISGIPNSLIVQSGIVVLAGTATLNDNTISDFWYTGAAPNPRTGAYGIAVVQAAAMTPVVTADNNVFSDVQFAVYTYGDAGTQATLTDSVIRSSALGDNMAYFADASSYIFFNNYVNNHAASVSDPSNCALVDFVTNCDTSLYSVCLLQGNVVPEPAALTKTGYTFGGWYQDAAFTAPAYDFSAPVTAAMIDPATAVMTLYAKWTVIRYAVTFDSRGGSDVDPITGIPYGNTAAEPNDPMLNSHVFGGWFLDPELTIQWNFNSDTVTKNIILYAKWLSASPPPTGIYPMVFLWTGIASLALFIGFIAAAYRKKYRPLHTKK